jgi:hypothetical protein
VAVSSPSTVSATVTSGVTDHAALSNLTYASAGHTGFQAAGSYLTAESDPVFLASEAAGFAAGAVSKLAGIEAGAEVNNISDVNATDLTDGNATTLHTHAPDHAAVTLDVNADTLLSLSTQAIGLDTQTANRIFSGPATGAAAVPTFRALVSADIPALDYVKTDQTTPQTIANGIPLMTTAVDGDGSGNQLVNKNYVDLAVSSLELTEFFSKAALSPAVSGFTSMDNVQASADTITSGNITGTTGSPTSLFKFLTPVNHPHLDRFLVGVYETHVHLQKSSTGGVVGLRFQIWQCNAAGAHTALLATSADFSGLTTGELPYEIIAANSTEVTLAVTDRLSCEWLGWKISGATITVTMTVGGTADSHIGIEVAASELQSVFVPYTGAEHDVDLATKTLTAAELISTLSGTITRTSGYISSVAKTGGRTLTVTRDGSNLISTIADGTRTWTFTRTANIITSWSVA